MAWPWVQAVVAVAALVTAFGVVWTRVVRPIARIEYHLPVLLDIAEQFRPNGGVSLRDVVDGLDKRLARLEDRVGERVSE